MKLGLVLMGAGNARRFGEDKLLYEIDGCPMGVTALKRFAEVDFAHRVFVTRADADLLGNEAKERGYLVAVNRDPSRGVSSSIAVGLQVLTMQGGFLDDGVLFAVCDQPYLTKESVQKLIDAFAEDPSRIAALSFEGRAGNPVIFPQKLVPELMKLSGDVGGRQVMKKHPELIRLVEADAERELKDVDEKGEV